MAELTSRPIPTGEDQNAGLIVVLVFDAFRSAIFPWLAHELARFGIIESSFAERARVIRTD